MPMSSSLFFFFTLSRLRFSEFEQPYLLNRSQSGRFLYDSLAEMESVSEIMTRSWI